MKSKNEIVPYNKKVRSKIITISGGKGGIGKTFFSVNFAIELKNRGYRVLIFDADLNLSNVNLHLHIDENNSFQSFIESEIPIDDLIRKGVGGVDVLYAGDDLRDIIDVDNDKFSTIANGLSSIEAKYDYIINDTQAGLNDFNIRLMLNSDRIIMVTNPEITAIVDLYKVIKVVTAAKPGTNFEIVVNKVSGGEGAVKIFKKISDTTSKFNIKTKLSFLGFIINDHQRVLESIQKRIPIVILHEKGNVKGCFNIIVDSFLKSLKPKRKSSFFFNLIKK